MTNNKQDNNKEARPQEKLSEHERNRRILRMFEEDNLPDPLLHWEDWTEENKNLMKIADFIKWKICENMARLRRERNAETTDTTGEIPQRNIISQGGTSTDVPDTPATNTPMNTRSRTRRAKALAENRDEQTTVQINIPNTSTGVVEEKETEQTIPMTQIESTERNDNPPIHDLTSKEGENETSNTTDVPIPEYTRETTPYDLQQFSRNPPVEPSERGVLNRPSQKDYDCKHMSYEQYKDFRHSFMYPRLYYPCGFSTVERWIREYNLQLDMRELAIRKYQEIVDATNTQRANVLLDNSKSKVEVECYLRAQQHSLFLHHQDKIVLELDILRRIDELKRYRDLKIAKKEWEMNGKLPDEIGYDPIKKRTVSITDEFENRVQELDGKLRGEVVNAEDPRFEEPCYHRERRLSEKTHERTLANLEAENTFHAHLRFRSMTP